MNIREIAVCSRHRKSNLWWYKGWIFDRGEQEAE
jgi:hypothetical protein